MKKQEKFISKEEKKKTGKLKRAIAVGATTLAAVGLCLNQTGALAYLTDYDHVTNKFTEGKVSITPSEPNWTHDPEDPEIKNRSLREISSTKIRKSQRMKTVFPRPLSICR